MWWQDWDRHEGRLFCPTCSWITSVHGITNLDKQVFVKKTGTRGGSEEKESRDENFSKQTQKKVSVMLDPVCWESLLWRQWKYAEENYFLSLKTCLPGNRQMHMKSQNSKIIYIFSTDGLIQHSSAPQKLKPRSVFKLELLWLLMQAKPGLEKLPSFQ